MPQSLKEHKMLLLNIKQAYKVENMNTIQKLREIYSKMLEQLLKYILMLKMLMKKQNQLVIV